jgi:hypothetical protein
LHTTGLYIAFYFQQQELKREMKQYLRQHLQDAAIVTFVLEDVNKASFDFTGEEEFAYNGILYDIVKKEKKGAAIILYCVDDKKETQLVHSFMKHEKRSSSNKEKALAFAQLLSTPYLSASIEDITRFSSTTIDHTARCICYFPQPACEILSPPPQDCCLIST